MKKFFMFLWDVLIGQSPTMALFVVFLLFIDWSISANRLLSVLLLSVGIPLGLAVNLFFVAVKEAKARNFLKHK
jgi:hypothetical protein